MIEYQFVTKRVMEGLDDDLKHAYLRHRVLDLVPEIHTFGLIERFSETCTKTKETSPIELVSLCVPLSICRTVFRAMQEVYERLKTEGKE